MLLNVATVSCISMIQDMSLIEGCGTFYHNKEEEKLFLVLSADKAVVIVLVC